MHANVKLRKSLVKDQDEHDILRAQEDFLQKRENPAATVTRVKPKPVSAAPAPLTTPPTGVQPAASVGGLTEGPPLNDIMGEVVEHSSAPPKELSAKISVASESLPFPAAPHRKESKFALGRRVKGVSSTSAAGAPTMPSAAIIAAVAQAPQLSNGGTPAAAMRGAATASAGVTDVHAIDRENRLQVAAMAPEEVAASLDELTSRLKPSALEFLRNRGAHKQQSAGSTASASATAPMVGCKTATAKPSQDRTVPKAGTATASKRALFMPPVCGGSEKLEGDDEHPTDFDAKAAGASRADAEPSVDSRLVARLRWTLGAQVVGLQATNDHFGEEEVLQRDILRQDEGSAPDGYTVGELLLLARSVVPAQRVAALRMLADVLDRARPACEDVISAGAGVAATHVPLPALMSAVAPGGAPSSRATLERVPWPALWDYAVRELVLAQHLRLALDDEHPAVLVAAADALAALLGPGAGEVLAYEVADACSNTGWPAGRSGYLKRVHPAGTWSSAALTPSGSRAATAMAQLGTAAAIAEEDPLSPEEVAATDPLSGLISMGLLQRARYILEVLQQPAAACPILSVLTACARASDEAALAVVRCPRMLDTLKALLQHQLPLASSAAETAQAAVTVAATARNVRSSGKGVVTAMPAPVVKTTPAAVPSVCVPGQAAMTSALPVPLDTGETAQQALRLQVLLLLRLLCQSSRLAANLVRSSGALNLLHVFLHVDDSEVGATTTSAAGTTMTSSTERYSAQHASGTEHLPEPASSSTSRAAASRPAGGMQLQKGLLRMEALRIWRACAHHGIALAMLDDVFPLIGRLLVSPSSNGDAAASPLQLLRWQSAREAYLLLATLTCHALSVEAGDRSLGRPMISPGAAAALAQDALVWLQDTTLQAVAHAAVAGGEVPAAWTSKDYARSNRSIHPSQLLQPAWAPASALSAALCFMATYWHSVRGDQLVFGQVQAALSASGLLFPPPAPALSQNCCDHHHACGRGGLCPPTCSGTGPVNDPQGLLGARHQLLSALLTRDAHEDGSATPAVKWCQVGAALAAYAVELAGRTITEAELRAVAPTSVLARRSGKAVACSLLEAVVSLARAAFRTSSGVATAPARADLTGGCHETCTRAHTPARPEATVVSQALNSVSTSLLAQAKGSIGVKDLAPWTLAYMQFQQHDVSLLLRLMKATPGNAAVTGGTTDTACASPAPAAAPEGDTAWLLAMAAALSVPALAAPGQETIVLAALRLALSTANLQRLLPFAQAQMSALPQDNPKLAAAVVGTRHSAGNDGSATAGGPAQGIEMSAGSPMPRIDSVDAQAVADTLFESYAASWLSLVPQRCLQAEPQQEGSGAGGGGSERGLLVAPAVGVVQGSRLPTPLHWPLAEAHVLPGSSGMHGTSGAAAAALQRAPASAGPAPAAAPPPASAALAPPSLHPVGCALLLALALDAAGSPYMALVPPQAKLQCALQLSYVFDANELIQAAAPPSGTEAAGGDSVGTWDTGEGSNQWQDPLVRWALAAFVRMHQQALSHPDWCSGALAVKLAEHFAAKSYGDTLFGGFIALLLLPRMRPLTVKSVWGALSQDKALHLLPPLAWCFGAEPSAFTSCATESATSTPLHAAAVDVPAAMLRSLVDGDLDKAIHLGSVSADLAFSAFVRAMLAPWLLPVAIGSVPATTQEGGNAASNNTASASTLAVTHPLPPVPATLRAGSMLRTLVRGTRPAIVARILQLTIAPASSVVPDAVRQALLHACEGDAELMAHAYDALALAEL